MKQDSFWRVLFAISNGIALLFIGPLSQLYLYTAYRRGNFLQNWYMGHEEEWGSVYNLYVDLVN
ncbi:MAG: hypothetical protein AAFR59_08350, partial [Bacteroidota bacterium]